MAPLNSPLPLYRRRAGVLAVDEKERENICLMTEWGGSDWPVKSASTGVEKRTAKRNVKTQTPSIPRDDQCLLPNDKNPWRPIVVVVVRFLRTISSAEIQRYQHFTYTVLYAPTVYWIYIEFREKMNLFSCFQLSQLIKRYKFHIYDSTQHLKSNSIEAVTTEN